MYTRLIDSWRVWFELIFLIVGRSETFYCCQIVRDLHIQLRDSTRGRNPQVKKLWSTMPCRQAVAVLSSLQVFIYWIRYQSQSIISQIIMALIKVIRSYGLPAKSHACVCLITTTDIGIRHSAVCELRRPLKIQLRDVPLPPLRLQPVSMTREERKRKMWRWSDIHVDTHNSRHKNKLFCNKLTVHTRTGNRLSLENWQGNGKRLPVLQNGIQRNHYLKIHSTTSTTGWAL